MTKLDLARKVIDESGDDVLLVPTHSGRGSLVCLHSSSPALMLNRQEYAALQRERDS